MTAASEKGEDLPARRAAELEHWEQAAAGWAAQREEMRAFGLPVSEWMIEAISPQSGQRVLELAAGVGDTGLMAAERLLPGGTLVCSDGSEAMLEVARARAQELGVENVEFKRLELEWIDVPTASVDAVLCRWGLMLVVDPGAAATEIRRVLRPGGRLAVAVWDSSELNPWATLATRALVELGFSPAPERGGPGPFALSAPGRLAELLRDAGFTEVTVQAIELADSYASLEAYIAERRDLSRTFAEAVSRLDETEWASLRERLGELVAPYRVDSEGELRMPARSLVASASA